MPTPNTPTDPWAALNNPAGLQVASLDSVIPPPPPRQETPNNTDVYGRKLVTLDGRTDADLLRQRQEAVVAAAIEAQRPIVAKTIETTKATAEQIAYARSIMVFIHKFLSNQKKLSLALGEVNYRFLRPPLKTTDLDSLAAELLPWMVAAKTKQKFNKDVTLTLRKIDYTYSAISDDELPTLSKILHGRNIFLDISYVIDQLLKPMVFDEVESKK
jgi:hypothetical protein